MLVKDKQQLIKFLRPLTGVWITGTSGSGKSSIGNTLKKLGTPVYDLDDDGQHAKFPSGLDLWVADANRASEFKVVVGTCDNDTTVLDKCKFKHVVLPKLTYELYVRVMEAKAIDHAKRHGKDDAFASDFGRKSKLTKSQYERNYKDNVRYFRVLSAFYGFHVHELHIEAFEDVKLVPWNRSGY